jgi:hypothetical protein
MTKLLIEINNADAHCGDCAQWQGPAGSNEACRLFLEPVGYCDAREDYERCPACEDAEEAAEDLARHGETIRPVDETIPPMDETVRPADETNPADGETTASLRAHLGQLRQHARQRWIELESAVAAEVLGGNVVKEAAARAGLAEVTILDALLAPNAHRDPCDTDCRHVDHLRRCLERVQEQLADAEDQRTRAVVEAADAVHAAEDKAASAEMLAYNLEQAYRAERDGTLALRRQYGAREGETFPAFIERLHNQRDQYHGWVCESCDEVFPFERVSRSGSVALACPNCGALPVLAHEHELRVVRGERDQCDAKRVEVERFNEALLVLVDRLGDGLRQALDGPLLPELTAQLLAELEVVLTGAPPPACAGAALGPLALMSVRARKAEAEVVSVTAACAQVRRANRDLAAFARRLFDVCTGQGVTVEVPPAMRKVVGV